jgi:hypothetical protein
MVLRLGVAAIVVAVTVEVADLGLILSGATVRGVAMPKGGCGLAQRYDAVIWVSEWWVFWHGKPVFHLRNCSKGGCSIFVRAGSLTAHIVTLSRSLNKHTE